MTMTISRRVFGVLVASAAFAFSVAGVHADDKLIRVGFQKYGKLVLLKNKGLLEQRLQPLGFKVQWTEFPSGPPLLEALNSGAIDFGNAGEAPPIFAQAAGVPLRYVAFEPPAPRGEAILVPKESALRTVADLKGKKIALNKGSNVHYLLVKALERASIAYADVQPVFLSPADARAAFERGAVDAWVIWDPFQSAAEFATGARTLADGAGLVANHQFYLASQAFAQKEPQAVAATLAALGEIDTWAKTDIRAVAEQLSPSIGLPVPVLERALERQSYGIRPIDQNVIDEQQRVADTFFALGLLPKPIKISDVAKGSGS